ncbi:hypothetical protein [Aestuariivivens sediminis]|uniref:hypothetical protein n=1 Tax=Aestuariivivens sediminis TaxID=2913557 RepID=UPI001F599CBB|nr:hypothetical protein [Aestuariivivens sediminis]
MKALKLVFLGMSLVLFSCGGEYFDGDDIVTESLEDFISDIVNDVEDALNSGTYDNKTYFNPPEWIIGNWYYDQDRILGFGFTESNFYEYFFTITFSNNKYLNYIENGEKKYSLDEETATDSTYYFEIINNFDFDDFCTYVFQKISNDSLNYTYSHNDGTHSNRKYYRFK